MKRFLVLFLMTSLCLGCSLPTPGVKPTPYTNDNLQESDINRDNLDVEYKIPIDILIWATEKTIK